MGRGGGGGGGSGGGTRRFRFRGLFGIGELAPDTKFILRRLAIAKGMRDVDDLLVKLGRQGDYISVKEAIHMLIKEGDYDEARDVLDTLFYQPGKGYRSCNELLDRYLENVNKPGGINYTESIVDRLKKYCGYTKEELKLLNLKKPSQPKSKG